MTRRAPGGRGFFSERQRRRIERLACRAPKSVHRNLTHWSFRSLAEVVVEQEYVPAITHATVREILRAADLRPNLFEYWKTTIWDDEAVERALRILWYYERTDSLWQRGEVIVAMDEKPNVQVLERAHPTQPMRPGQVERQEFDYFRHGTIQLLASLTLHTGRMGSECLARNDGEHFRPALQRLLHPYSWAKCIDLVLDNGSSHISAETTEFFENLAPRVRVLPTPANASWLNQAEALLEAFSGRYLKRGSWNSQPKMVQHILRSTCEYNQCFAHPFAWGWTCRDFQYWLNNTPGLIRCKT